MSARALLTNPALFAGYHSCPWPAVEAFLRNVVRAPIPYQLVQHHLAEMCGPGLGPDRAVSLLDKYERKKMLGMSNLVDVIDFADEMVRVKAGREEGVSRESWNALTCGTENKRRKTER
jgi:tRNA-dihydrouridine synthase 4